MPTTNFIAQTEVVNNRKGRPETAEAKAMRLYCVETVGQALADGKAADITLDAGERYSAIVPMLKEAAANAKAAVSFRNIDQRTYQSGTKTLTEYFRFQAVIVAIPAAPASAPVAE